MTAPGRPAVDAADRFRADVAALIPQVAARAVDTERLRRIPDETMAAVRGAGILRALQPRRWGGAELAPTTFFDGVLDVAAVCGSTGWVLSVLGVHAWQLGLFDDQAQAEVWGDDRDALIASSFAPVGRVEPVAGGFALSGRWSFSSGCDHCSWALLGGVVSAGDGAADIRTFLVPRRDYAIDDDWHVAGLVGSGSKTLVLEGVHVPEHRTLRASDVFRITSPGLASNGGPLFRLPLPGVFAWCIAAPAIGVARGAVAEYAAQVRSRVDLYDRSAVSASPFAQRRYAAASAEVAAAADRLRATLGDMYTTVCGGGAVGLDARARSRWDAAHAVERSVRAVDLLFEAAGGRALYLTNPLQRAFRDIHAMRAHATNDPDKGALIYARSALGVGEPDLFI
jgi:3-hydroxy-9,10-secoandrosta-1,3,5(10)-triene-9,17-dione monooxygenase